MDTKSPWQAYKIIEQPTEKIPVFQLPRKEWLTLNRLRTENSA